MEDIEAGLDALAQEIRERNIRSIAVPPLGSNLGGLSWDDVRPRVEAALGDLDNLTVLLFEPGGGPAEDRPNRSTKTPRMTRGRAALVSLMDRYLRGLLDPFVTLLEVHKLMYFMQEAGEPLQLGACPRIRSGRRNPPHSNLITAPQTFLWSYSYMVTPLETHIV